MELWIRSQDRCTLEKVNYLSVGGTYRNEILTDDCCSVGKYKSKERALEVLDEIQKDIRSKYTISLKPERAFDGVYEMPEE